MSSFNLSTFKKTVPQKIVNDGESTYKQGCVKKIDSNKNNEWTAEVTIGSEVFNVEIMIDDEKNILDHFCDCPTDSEHCRHQVATFFKLKEVLPTLVKQKAKAKEKAPPKPKKLSPVEAILVNVSFQELQEFVRKNSDANKAFKNLFFIHFADKNENISRKYYFDLLKTTASNIKKTGYFGVRDTTAFMKVANEIAQKASNAIELGKYKDFAPIGLAFIETTLSLSKRLDSSEYNHVISTQFKDINQVAQKCPSDLKIAIIKEYLEIIEANLTEFFETYRSQFIESLTIFSKEKDLGDVFLAFLNKHTIQTKNGNRYYWEFKTARNDAGSLTSILVDIQKKYFEVNKMDEKIMPLLSNNLHINQFRKEYINYLMAKNDYTEAIKIIEILYSHSYSKSGQVDVFWYDTIQEIYQKLNDNDGMAKLHLFRFKESQYTNLTCLTELKKLISAEKWKDTFTVLEKEMIKSNQRVSYFGYYGNSQASKLKPIKLGHLYAFDERWEELYKMMISNNDLESYGTFSDVLLKNYFNNTYDVLNKKLIGFLKDLYPQNYEHLANIIEALKNNEEKTKTLFDEIIHKIKTFHLGKKTLVSALAKRGISF